LQGTAASRYNLADTHSRSNAVPTYEYRCDAGHQYEKREGFDAPAKQKCEKCGKPASRMIFAPPIVFKGSGFYKTDSRGASSDGAAESPPSAPATTSGDGHGHSHGPGGHTHGDSSGDSVESAAAS
jgi:putative FmdB family regulatory protein